MKPLLLLLLLSVLFLLVTAAGYARIVLTLAALACARQYPLLCVTTYFLA